MPRLTPAVIGIIAINVILYFGTASLPWLKELLVLYYPGHDMHYPTQYITHMFMHAGTGHLLMNMYAVFLFGPPLESRFGTERFLAFYFITGIGAFLLFLAIWFFEFNALSDAIQISRMSDPDYYLLGASGAVFGLLAGFGTCFPDVKLRFLFVPFEFKAKWFVIGYAVVELILGVSSMTTSLNTGVAHFAHLGGALFGFLLMRYYMRKFL